MIAPPTLPRGHPSRARECEDVLEREAFRLFDLYGVPPRFQTKDSFSQTKSEQADVWVNGIPVARRNDK